jgi:hypothetical protein
MSNATVLNPHPTAAITLRGIVIPLASDIGGAFISDCARNREKIFSDQRLCEKYGITLEALTEIGRNPAVRLAVSTESERRLQNGDAARESAAKLFADAPSVLGKILNNEQASPRHRIEAAKELRATAQPGTERTGDTAERVVVHINLGGDQKLTVDSGPLKQNEARNLDAE